MATCIVAGSLRLEFRHQLLPLGTHLIEWGHHLFLLRLRIRINLVLVQQMAARSVVHMMKAKFIII